MSNYIVEKHFIKRTHSAWVECDSLCFKAKNLYNQALYRIRQHFFKTGKFKNYSVIQKELQNEKADCYTQMKSKISQLILQHVNQDFLNFFASLRAWKRDPSKFLGKPHIPHYKEKDGRCSVSFNIQSMSKRTFNKGILQLSSLFLSLKLQHPIRTITKNRKIKNSTETKEYKTISLKEVTIIPYNNGYLIIVKHEIEDNNSKELNGLLGGGDLGVNSLIAISTNVKNSINFIINGRPLKSINQYYNKKLAELKSEFDLCKTRSGKKKINNKIKKLCRKRNHKVEDYLHKASRILVNRLASLGVTHLIIGKNIEWKQEVNMKSINNQNFVQIPHDKFIKMLKYKWEALGLKFSISEESYSSKCSFLDNESLEHHNKYLGRRVKRGLFKSHDGYFLNADINGSANIVRKVVRDAWAEWSQEDLIEGFVVSPVNLIVPQPRKKLKQVI
jgi:putative transposase